MGDDSGGADREALHRELEGSIGEADAGFTDDFAEMLAELQQRRAG